MLKKFIYALIIGVIMALTPFKSDAGVILVLSGGGTKGFAHLGVMEALEQNGVEIVGIVGTSMGALMGALRASGYSTQEMHKIISELDLPSLLSENTGPMFVFSGNDRRAKTSTIPALTYIKRDGERGPKGLLTGDKLYNYFSQLMRHVSETHFYRLPIPYAAVATDINTGEKIVLREGSIAAAMRASMSIPALFEPWIIDGHLLVDGGVTSNLPVYTARDIFPNIPIVAVDISDALDTSHTLGNYMDVISQALTILMRKTTNEEAKAADILLRPKVEGLGMLDSTGSENTIKLGYDAAMEKIDEIKALSARGPGLYTIKRNNKLSEIVGDIEVHGLPPKTAELVRKEALKWIGRKVKPEELDHAMEKLSEAQGIEMADYQLGRTNSGDILVRIDVRQSPELKVGISGYSTNLHSNRWLYLKGEARGLLSEYDSLIGVAKLGDQWGIDLTYQTAPPPLSNSWQFTLSAQKWEPAGPNDPFRNWKRYAAGFSKLFVWGNVNVGIGLAYEHVEGDSISESRHDDKDSVGPTFFAEYDTLDIPGDPTKGYSWRFNAWWPDLEEVVFRANYFKPLKVSEMWRIYFRAGFAEGDMNRRSHAVYLGAAEELYSIARNPIEAERMFWTNLAFRRIITRTAMGVIAAEVFASWGYAMDKEWHKIDAPWEVGLAVNFPNNLVDMKFAIMHGSEEDFKTGFFIGIPIWDHYPLP